MKKKYIITDPCYILPDNVWVECLNKTHAASSPFDNNMFMSLVEKALSEYTGAKAFVNITGCGDWSNILWNQECEPVGEFRADSGMVCIVKCTNEIKDKIKSIPHCGAIFETDGEITVKFNTDNPTWTVIKIQDTNFNTWTTTNGIMGI